MRNKGFAIAIVLMASVAGAAFAEEVIHFTNGTVMPIRSHKVEGDLIKVDLGDNGFMAFPKSVVERIEEASDVILTPSAPNKMFPSDPSTRVFGASPRQASDSWALPTKMDADSGSSELRAVGGVVSRTPFPSDAHPAARNLRVNNIPEIRGANQISAQDQVPGAPKKLENPSVKKKRVFTELKSRD